MLKHEGLVGPSSDNPRTYARLDGKVFFAEVAKLMGTTKAAALGKAKSKSTATLKTTPAVKGTTAPAPDAKPATPRPAIYVSEVHGPLVPEPRKPAKKAPAKR